MYIRDKKEISLNFARYVYLDHLIGLEIIGDVGQRSVALSYVRYTRPRGSRISGTSEMKDEETGTSLYRHSAPAQTLRLIIAVLVNIIIKENYDYSYYRSEWRRRWSL